MLKNKLIKRLEWYYPTEKFNAYLFLCITIYVGITNKLSDTLLLIYGLSLMTFILFQGQYYWKLKLYRLKKKDIEQTKNLELFRSCKKINIILIAFMPFLFALQWIVILDKSESIHLFFWGLLANLVGVLEHINYYHRQLMIDNLSDVKYLIRYRKLKIASLKKDLDENKM